jgi:hypothetical protein
MRAVEHITLDSGAGIGTAPVDDVNRATLLRHAIPGHAEGSGTELSILEGHYLRVRITGPRGAARDYQFDLRFANPAPVRMRRVPWVLLWVATGLVAIGLGALAAGWPALGSTLGPGGMAGLFVALIATAATGVVLRWTRESLQLRSVHGSAILAGVTGRLGSTRRHEPVFAEIGRSILAARQARPQEKPQFLRDEMREHYRLRKLGVLTEKEYEAAKAAILAAH